MSHSWTRTHVPSLTHIHTCAHTHSHTHTFTNIVNQKEGLRTQLFHTHEWIMSHSRMSLVKNISMQDLERNISTVVSDSNAYTRKKIYIESHTHAHTCTLTHTHTQTQTFINMMNLARRVEDKVMHMTPMNKTCHTHESRTHAPSLTHIHTYTHTHSHTHTFTNIVN